MRKVNFLFFTLVFTVFINISFLFAGEDKLSLFSEDENLFLSEEELPEETYNFDDFLKGKVFLDFNKEKWNRMREKKEEGYFFREKEREKEEEPSFSTEEPKDEGLIEIDFPYESQLSISGRKKIKVKAEWTQYPNKEENITNFIKSEGTNIEMDQELQVRIKGKVGRKVSVNVDYNDTQEDKRDISVVYKGDPGEIVQQAAFGDITLSLPSTEFVSYNKNVFGIKLDAKYKRLGLMAIGSRTKGLTEVKRFKGSTIFEKKEIKDINYTTRKYYKLEHTQIKRETEEIWIDFKDGYEIVSETLNKDMEGKVWNSTTTYTGYFDKQFRGQDYTIDYDQGIITFRKSIASNYVIIIDYEDENGTEVSSLNSNQYLIIKDEEDSLPYELKNYYNLGSNKIIKKYEEDFVLKIINLAREEQNLADYEIDYIDYDLGILKFKEEEPFSTAVYNKNESNRQHQHIIYVEYKYRVKTYILRPDIVLNSERIIMNNQLIQKDRDYMIDYDSGFVTFFNEEKIDEDTNIEITYEYAPFGGQSQQTLVGSRLQYGVNTDPFFIGSTVIWSGTDKPSTAPSIYSTPQSVLVLDLDGRVKLESEGFPLKATLSGEIARSQFNPNLFDKAMIDNMEGVKLVSSIPLDKDFWQLSSNPLYEDTTDINAVTLKGALIFDNEDIKRKEIVEKVNPGWLEEVGDSEEVEALTLNYNLKSLDEEASIVYPISTVGADYSKKMFLEICVWGDGEGEQLEIHLGGISENADGRGVIGGQPKTEDVDGDGILGEGEDIGWQFVHPDESVTYIGADNGVIDTQDLDGDNVLDDKNSSGNFYNQVIDWLGWKKIKIPLDIIDEDQWSAIKHIRLSIRNKSIGVKNGTIKISAIEIVGTKWDKGVKEEGSFDLIAGEYLTIEAINNEDDQEYQDITEYSEYKSLYRYSVTEKRKEQALALTYTLNNSTGAYTKTTFTRAQDYSKYKKIKFFLFANKANGSLPLPTLPEKVTFYIQFGTDDSNYYEYEETIDSTMNWADWKVCTIYLNEDKNKDNIPDGFSGCVGNPGLNNIMQIKVGVRNDTGAKIENGEIWINELFVDEVGKKEGIAWKSAMDLELPGWFNAQVNHKEIDGDFETITTGSSQQDLISTRSLTGGQEIKLESASLEFTRFKFLPLSFQGNHQKTVTPSAYDTPYSSYDEGKVESISGEGNARLVIPRWPSLEVSYAEDHSESKILEEKKDTITQKGSLAYNIPGKYSLLTPKKWEINLLPTTIDISYRQKKYVVTKTTSTTVDFNGYSDLTENFSGRLPFKFWKGFYFSPVYYLEIIRARERETDISNKNYKDKYRAQTVSFDSGLKVFSWLNPSFNYKINSSASYDFNENKIESITRNSNGQLSYSLRFENLFPKLKPLHSLTTDNSYKVETGDSYDVGDEDEEKAKARNIWSRWEGLWLFDQGDKLNLEDITTRSFSNRQTGKTTNRWKPFSFLDLDMNKSFYPLKNMETRVNYTEINDYKEVGANNGLKIFTKIWPDLIMDIGEIEKFFNLNTKVITNSKVSIKYSQKTVETEAVSKLDTQTYGGHCRLDILTDYSVVFDYEGRYNKTRKVPDYNNLSRHGFTKKGSIQVEFFWKKWRFVPNYEYRAEEENEEGTKTKWVVTRSPSLRIRADITAKDFIIPIIKLPLKNRLLMDTLIKYERKSGIQDKKDNTDTYSLDVDCTYDTSENLKITLGVGGSFFRNRKEKKDNYWSISLLADLSIVF
ncbi:hypothetical protein KAI68_02445 [bacterium]|nr:hypothetical protein [bacterium]